MEDTPVEFRNPNHLINIQSCYKNLSINNKYSDVTLVSEDRTVFNCHKVILSAASSALESILNIVGHQNLAIYLRGIYSSELNSVIEFIYKGETSVSTSNLQNFLAVATELKLVQNDDMFVNEFEAEREAFEKEPYLKLDENQDVTENHVNTNFKTGNSDSIYYHCDKCEFKSVHKHNVKVHDHNLHTGLPMSCEQCEYKTTRKDVMTKHIQARHEDLKIKCHLCDYESSTRSTLNYHIRVKHEGLSFPCKDCAYQATNTSSLKSHKERVHDKLTHPCNICDFQATGRDGVYAPGGPAFLPHFMQKSNYIVGLTAIRLAYFMGYE